MRIDRDIPVAIVPRGVQRPEAGNGRLLIKELLNATQRTAQGLRIGASPAARQRGLEIGGYWIRCRCSGLTAAGRRSMTLGNAWCSLDYAEGRETQSWSVVAHQ